ncbi:MAG: filamentous hemagglutinin family protein [Sulfuricella sp.]
MRRSNTPRVALPRIPRFTASASAAVLAASGVLWLAGAEIAGAAPMVPPALLAPLPGTLPNRPGGAPSYQQPTVKSGPQTDAVYDITGNTGTISQSTARAILEWNNFDIASDSAVVFRSTQPGQDFVTLNRVLDPSANPSQIYGSITADHGQVYLINRNGILFGSGAQINVSALVASALNISDSDFTRGLLPNVDMNQNHPFNWDGDSSGLAALSGKEGFLSSLVRVESGASINAAEGGFVMLLGPRVANNGSISTPGGQTVLAAGATVYLGSAPASGEGTTQENGYRGFLVEVDPYKDQEGVPVRGEVSNFVNGLINAPRGNVTLVGYAINQSGRISATTSVNQNGTVRLLARDTMDANSKFGSNTGSVELGQGSTIEILPEETYSETLSATGEKTLSVNTIQDAQAFHSSIVDVVGGSITMLENSSIRAPGGLVNLSAQTHGTDFNAAKSELGNASRVYMAAGSVIDVSGTEGVQVAAERDVIEVELRGSVVQDNPLLRDSPLYGETVWVDIRKGTSLLDISSYVAQIGRTAGEKTSAGGTVAMQSEGDIVLREGSTVNFSGGSIDYSGGAVRANSKFISNGRVYDVATASPDLVYSGILGTFTVEHAKWGVTETFNGPGQWVYSPAYREGQNAGQATFSGFGMALNGTLLGKAAAGPTQLAAGRNPLPGKLSIVDISNISNLAASAYMPVMFAAQKALLPSGFTPDGESQSGKTLTISTGFLRDGGIGRLEVTSNGKIRVPEGVSLDVTPSSGMSKGAAVSSSVTLKGSAVDIAGSISAPSGKISLKSTAGAITLGPDSTLDASGAWINNTPAAASPTDMAPLLINGGSVSLNAEGPDGNVTLAAGSLIDVSGGAKADASGKLTGGKGGSITINSGSILPGSGNAPDMVLDGELRGYGVGTQLSGGSGGSLTLGAQSVRIAPDAGATPSATPGGELNLDPDFFRKGGFASYTVNGQNGLKVAAGSDVRPQAARLVLDQDAKKQRSGAGVYGFSQAMFLPEAQRQAASISLSAGDRYFGVLTLEQGAAIRVDPAASVNLSAGKQLTVLGSVDAPAGTIGLSLNAFDKLSDIYDASQSIWLGASARLSATGYAQYAVNNTGLRQGEVLRGGNVNINAGVGYVVAESGSVVDVSGLAPVTLDILQKNGRQTIYVPTQVAGDAGSISITAREGMFLDGKLLGAPGGGQAAGGTLALTLARAASERAPSPFPVDPVSIVVQNEGASIPLRADGSKLEAGDWIDTAYLPNSAPATLAPGGNPDSNGKAFISAEAVKAGGFDSLLLTSQDKIEFRGGAELSLRSGITLDAPELVFKDKAGASNQVNLTAAYVSMGPGNAIPIADVLQSPAGNPTSGNGLLTVNANLIDLQGTSTLQGFDKAGLYSKTDIRLKGVTNSGADAKNLALDAGLSSGGDMQFTANQIYPSSYTNFTLAVLNPDGSTKPDGTITVKQWAPGLDSPVLSAGGKLTLIAGAIDQQGVLKAPFGRIVLGDGSGTVHLAPGSVTSVSAEGLIIPFGQTQLSGTSYQYGGKALNDAPPEKSVLLDGDKVDVDSGATINLTGGGDLHAYEFIAGTGGSTDVLNPATGTAYAILPWLKSAAPYDYQEYHAPAIDADGKPISVSPNLKPGDSIYLAASNGLAAGYYTLLPARYALLDGAYLVKPVAGYRDMSASQSFKQADGTTIVPGYLTTTAYDGSRINDSRASGFSVAPGDWARSRSEYSDTYASNFYAANPAFQAPSDAGRLSVSGISDIILQGTILASAASGGRGAEVDISSNNIVIGSGTHANAVTLDVETLNNLGAASLLIGGIRSRSSDGVTVVVGAGNVTVADTATPGDTASEDRNSLHAPEVILAASDQVTVKAGATVAGSGEFSGTPKNISIAGNGALLRVSSGDQVSIARPGSDTALATGNLTVESGAYVKAAKSMLLDATNDSKVASGSTILGDSAALGVSSSLISIGDVGNVNKGLAYSNADLAQFDTLSRLSLISYSTLDMHGKVDLGNSKLDLDLQSGGIRGFEGATAEKNVSITANTLTLSNLSGTAFTSPGGNGDGSLGVTAQKVVLGKGGLAPADANGIQALRGVTIEGFDSVTLAANEITGTGSGSLDVKGTLTPLTLQAARLTGEGAGVRQSITSTGTVAYTRPSYLDPAYLATQSVEKQNELLGNFNSLLASLRQTASPLDTRFEINSSGGAVLVDGVADLPAGGFKASAAQDVTLGGNAQINAGGVAKQFVDTVAYAPGGNVVLTSAGGNVIIETGAQVDVSGADGGDAGSLKISAVAGSASLDGSLKGYAHADTQGNSGLQGSFSLDVATLESGFSVLNDKIAAGFDDAGNASGGFAEAVDVRVRSGNLSVAAADVVKAHQFTLEADNGKIDVKGTIDASGDKGGSIGLYASGDVTLAEDAILLAYATKPGNDTAGTGVAAGTAGQGGKVVLSSASGWVDVQPDSTIDVHGGGNGAQDGSILLRAKRNDGNTDVNVKQIAGTISGASEVVVEGYKTYERTSISAADVSTSGTLYTDARDFMGAAGDNANANAIKSRIDAAGVVANFHVRPGIEVKSSGDLELDAVWDLLNWRFDGEPGVLTLRAGGDLNINQSLSDGFDSTKAIGINLTVEQKFVGAPLVDTTSWSYRLVAGADLGAANPLAVESLALLQSGKGSLNVAKGIPRTTNDGTITNSLASKITAIRTGSGDIDIAAGRDVVLKNAESMIYTAGRPDSLLAGTKDSKGLIQPANFYPDTYGLLLGTVSAAGNYPKSGGDITIRAQGDVEMKLADNSTTQLIGDWLFRRSGVDANGNIASATPTTSATKDIASGYANLSTSWFVYFPEFEQNVGALGGGDVSVVAGGNINNLSVVIPTTGWMSGKAGDPALLSNLHVNGGGDLTVRAGGDIAGGLFYVGQGKGTISAGGALLPWTKQLKGDTTLYTILALGRGEFEVRTGGGLNIGAVLNPTVVGQIPWDTKSSSSLISDKAHAYFYTYAADSSVSLNSLSGDVNLLNDTAAIEAAAPQLYADSSGLSVYPPTLRAAALQGDVTVNALTLFPSATGNLELLANGSVILAGNLTVSDADPALLSSPIFSFTDGGVFPVATIPLPSQDLSFSTMLHEGDNNPIRVYALEGDISSKDDASHFAYKMTFPKQSRLVAGQDIINFNLIAQNLASTDVTGLTAGRDVLIASTLDAAGNIVTNDKKGVTIGGPGRLEVVAGRNVDLGTSDGLVSRGNLDNAALPHGGASIAVSAGVAGEAAYSLFVEKYFSAAERRELADYVRTSLKQPALTEAEALAAFGDPAKFPYGQSTLPAAVVYAQEIRRMFFDELKQAGIEQSKGGNYDRGFDAVAALFPAATSPGDINLFFSQIKTVQGGGIDLMAPGGLVNAGLSSTTGVDKKAPELGIVTVDGGSIRSFSRGNFLVNQSRVFTLGGGDILIWSSEGDIDAGKGSKTASATPPPTITTDPKTGLVTVDTSNAVSGSGIAVLLAKPGISAGRTDLIAPMGTVNAGDAGIRAAGDLNIAALHVVGAENIQFGGVATGVPVAHSGALGAGMSGVTAISDGGAASEVTRGLTTSSESLQKIKQAMADFRPTFITVEVISLGD